LAGREARAFGDGGGNVLGARAQDVGREETRARAIQA
jgi:hypothetical protein